MNTGSLSTASVLCRRVPAWVLLGAVVLVAVLYATFANRAGLLNFDDNLYFGPANPEFYAAFHDRQFQLLLSPDHTIANAYLPVSHSSLFVDYALMQWLDVGPAVPHWHSVILHGLATAVLLVLLRRIGLGPGGAFGAALLFAVHPALVESVGWVSGRKDVLSGLLVFGCLAAVARQTGEPRPWRTLLAILLAAAAVYAKGTAVVLALLVPVVAWLAARRISDRSAGGFGRAGLAVFGVMVVTIAGGAHHAYIAGEQGTLSTTAKAALEASGEAGDAPAGAIGQAASALTHYLKTAAWPARLNVLYPEVATLERFRADGLIGVGVLVAWLLAGLWLVVGARGERGGLRRLAGGGLLCALLALAPFNTAWPASSIAAADRYLYLALPWLVLALVAGIGWVLPHRVGGVVATVAPLLLAVALVPWTRERQEAFEGSRALWLASLETDPNNAVAAMNAANTFVTSAPDRAVELLEQAFGAARYDEHRLRAAGSLRDMAFRDGRTQAATTWAEAACAVADRLDASRPGADVAQLTAWLRGASIAHSLGRAKAARIQFARAQTLAPEHPVVLAFESQLLFVEARQQLVEQVSEQEESRSDPTELARSDLELDADADMVRRLAELPETKRALRLLDAALEAAPRDFEVNLAKARWEIAQRNFTSGLKHLIRARRADPQRVETYLDECDLYLATGDAAGAERIAQFGMEMQIRDPALLLRYGQALTRRGRLKEAQSQLEQALRVRPRDLGLRRILGGVIATRANAKLFELPPDQLEQAADQVETLDPTNGHVALFRGRAKWLQRDLLAAQVLYEAAAETMPTHEDVAQLLAEVHRDRGYAALRAGAAEVDGMIAHFREFLARAPANVEIDAAKNVLEAQAERSHRAGVKAVEAGDFGTAELEFRRALAANPAKHEMHMFLAIVLLQRGGEPRLREALEQLDRAEAARADEGGDVSLAVLYRIRALRALARTEDAMRVGREFLAAHPKIEPAMRKRLEAAMQD